MPTAYTELTPVIFDPIVMAKRVNQAEGQDLITTSANNLYDGVTQAEVEAYFAALKNPNDTTPISYGLNSRKVKKDGKVIEEVYSAEGLYGEAIKVIVSLAKGNGICRKRCSTQHHCNTHQLL